MATITKRGQRWLVQIRRKAIPTVSRTFATHADAKAWAVIQEARIESALPISPRKLLAETTYGDILRRYREEVTPHKKSAATETQRTFQIGKCFLASLSLIELTSTRIAEYRDARLQFVRPGTVRRELALISHSLEIARKEWGYSLPANPVRDIRLPAMDKSRNRRLEFGELQRICESLRGTRNMLIRPVILLAIETGLRRGELLSLTWKAIDLARRTAHIPDTKNGYARTIPLTDLAIGVIRSLPRQDERLFPMTPMALKLAWNRLRGRAGMPDLRFHDLRHEAITRFAEMGLTTVELAVISGHRDLKMLSRYTHLQPAHLARKLAGRSWEQEVSAYALPPPFK